MWNTIPCTTSQLCLKTTLTCGQSFRWRQLPDDEWIGVLKSRVFILKQAATTGELQYRVVDVVQNQTAKDKSSRISCVQKIEFDCSSFLRDYFQLDFDLEKEKKIWIERDKNLKKKCEAIIGLRILRQDPVETVFSFLCSSNNNISRITGMIERMCSQYGDRLLEYDGQEFFAFPSVDKLAQPGVENKLRELGFGYRAQYVADSARFIAMEGGDSWLHKLRTVEYKEAHSELIKLPGVGPKVADCVCLMSLDKPCALPVDVHVKRLAVRDYLPSLGKTKSLTHDMYFKIGDYFRELWGVNAGWAQEILFMAELQQKPERMTMCEKKVKQRMTEETQNELKNKRKKRKP